MNELKLPEPDTHCLDDEGGRPIDVWSYSPELVRQTVTSYASSSSRWRADFWARSAATNRHVHACDACKPKLAPAWHDKPTAPGLWVVGSRCLHINELDLPIYKNSNCRWFGPIPDDGGKP